MPMPDTYSAAEQAFATWCDSPRIKRDRMRRRQQWAPFLAGWIEGQRAHAWRSTNPPGNGQTVTLERLQAEMAAPRRCETRQVNSVAECMACGAIEGEACRDPRKNPRTFAGDGLKTLIVGEKSGCE